MDVKLEALKLAALDGRLTPTQVVEKAKVYEGYLRAGERERENEKLQLENERLDSVSSKDAVREPAKKASKKATTSDEIFK